MLNMYEIWFKNGEKIAFSVEVILETLESHENLVVITEEKNKKMKYTIRKENIIFVKSPL